jgi:hypothetical protein
MNENSRFPCDDEQPEEVSVPLKYTKETGTTIHPFIITISPQPETETLTDNISF